MNLTNVPARVHVCCQAGHRALADRIAPLDESLQIACYDERAAIPPDAVASEPVRRALLRVIAERDVVVCLIGEFTRTDAWIDWEIRATRASERPPGLVGVLIEPWCVRPRALVDVGAIFVPFQRDAVERAIRWAAEEPRRSGDFELRDD